MDWQALQIAFLLSTLPGLLMALSTFASPDAESMHRILTGVFTVIWLIIAVIFIRHYFSGATCRGL